MSAPAHRAGVGDPGRFDVLGAYQFALLTTKLGMRAFHYLLDIGCGSLRGGRFAITYLAPGHYFGIEPDKTLLEAGIREEVGEEWIARKKPVFSDDATFSLTVFGRKFDYLLAQSIFTHATPAQVQRCLQEAAKVMHHASTFAATYFPGAESNAASEWTNDAVRYRAEDLFEWAYQAGLRAEALDWYHPSQKWLLFTPR